MTSPIERIYVARSEPGPIIAGLRERGFEVLVDEDDGIDYILTGNKRAVVIERKEASDLLRSFIDPNETTGEPRIIAQLRRLAETRYVDHWDAESSSDIYVPTLRVLLIERNIGSNRHGYATVDGGLIATKIPYNAIDNFLLVVQGWGFRVARSPSPAQTPARLVSIAEGWLSTEDKEPILMLPKATPSQLRTPMTFPGLGIKRSKNLFKNYVSLRMLLQAILDDEAIQDTGVRAKVKAYLDKPITWTDKRG